MFETDSDGVPKDPSAYRSLAFWQSRYSLNEHHEWLALSEEQLRAHFSPLLHQGTRVLVLGCGTSSFSRSLHNMFNCDSILSVDFAPSAIEHMKRVEPGMQWAVMDVCRLDLPDHCQNVVVDKATLDAIFSDGGSPWSPSDLVNGEVGLAVREAWRVLKGGGWFVSVSLGQPHFRLPLFTGCAEWANVQSHPLGTFSHIYKLQKPLTLVRRDE
jgi:ubiquinone/menaquinone biosynthesis C-methylase UbiE